MIGNLKKVNASKQKQESEKRQRGRERGSRVADARIGLVNDLDHITAQVRVYVHLDGHQLHARIAENQIRMLLHRLEHRKVYIPTKT